MPMQLIKEALTGKYSGTIPALLLPVGSIADGKNMRKVSSGGGWKPRKGVTLHNSTRIATAPVLSLHRFKHPRCSDYHFLAQCNSTLVDATNDPPASGTTFGTDITNGQTISSTRPGFSDVIRESLVYADGNLPLVWGGDGPFCTGFLCYDDSEDTIIDHTRIATDNRTDTEVIAIGAADDVWYICSPEIARAITLNLGSTVNSNAVTATLSSWQSGAWSDRSATDGTQTGGDTTMAQDGSLTWTASSSDTMRVLGGIMGYWYRISFSGALSNSVDVISCKATYDLATMTNKWDGVYEVPLSVRFYDQSAGEYLDLTGKLTVESTATYFNMDGATTSDFLYFKSKWPLTGIGFGVVPDYENDTGGGNIDQIDDWDGDSWNAITTNITDETLNGAGTESFAQTGMVWWNATSRTVAKRTMPFDSVPGYWYRISWDAAPDNAADDVRVYFSTVVPFPEALPTYKGAIEFKGRTFLWGDPEFPNRLRYSAFDKPDCFSGSDSGYTDPFGDMTEVVRVVRFYNELLIFKEDSIWMLEGYNPATFGGFRIADTIGCCAPKTVEVIETGYPSMHANEPLSIAIWMDTDGIYVLDGRKPRKVSDPVEQFFDTENALAIGAAYLDDAQAFPDRLKNEYHLLLSNEGSGHGTELVYNYITDEFYPPWDRAVGGSDRYLVCGIHLRGTDGRYYTYGGQSNGKVFRLEYDTTDKDSSGADVVITHYLTTRAISYAQKQSISLDFTFREAWLESKARTTPTTKTITTYFLRDMETTGTEITTPSAISLANSGYGVSYDGIDANQPNCKCFQLKFQAATADLEMEAYSFVYTIDLGGEIGL